MSLKRKSVKAIFWTLSEQFGLGFFSFLIDIYLTRKLQPHDFGLIGMILVFMGIGQVLIDSGMTSSLIRTQDPDEGDLSTVFFMNMGTSLFMYAIIYFASPWIAAFYRQNELVPVLRLYSLGFVILACTAVQQTIMVKNLNFQTHAKIQISARFVAGAAGILLAMRGYGVYSLVYMYLINQTLLSALFWLNGKWLPKLIFSKEKYLHHLGFGYKLALSSLLETGFSNLYYLVIGRIYSPVVLGYYTKANQLRQYPVTSISSALSVVTFPLFAQIQDQPEKLRIAYKKLMQQVIFILAPLLLGASALANPLFLFLFLAKWLPAVPYFQILCLVGILYPVHLYNLNILKVFGRSDLFLRLEVIKKILILISIVLTIHFGIFALLAGQLLNSIISFVINSYYSGKFISYTTLDQVRDILPSILIATAVALTMYGLHKFLFFDLRNGLQVLLGAGIGICLYTGLSFLFKIEALLDSLQLAGEFYNSKIKRPQE